MCYHFLDLVLNEYSAYMMDNSSMPLQWITFDENDTQTIKGATFVLARVSSPSPSPSPSALPPSASHGDAGHGRSQQRVREEYAVGFAYCNHHRVDNEG